MAEREIYRRTEQTPLGRQERYEERVVSEPAPELRDDVERDIFRQRVVGPAGEQLIASERVHVPSEASRRAARAARTQRIITYVFTTICVLLVIRFLLLLFGASQAAPIVSALYALTLPFVLPFQGIFGQPSVGASVVETASMVAVPSYALLAVGINRLVRIWHLSGRSHRAV
jgi:uncharacterized protein YggT (Ycf19 family)